MGKIIALTVSFLILSTTGVLAQEAGTAAPEVKKGTASTEISPPVGREGRTSSGLPIPRFVSLASEKVFVRTGPALRYPIKWIYQRDNLPVEVVQEFDTWRKIRDMDGDDGWVHQSLLSGERTVIVKGERNLSLYRNPDENSRVTAMLEPGVIAITSKCEGLWCELSSNGYRGYAQRKFLWGIYESEDFD